MKTNDSAIPLQYQQPDHSYTGRITTGGEGTASYSPAAHVKIIYNNQSRNFDVHHHTAMEIIISRQTHYTVYTADASYGLNPGDIIMIPPFLQHRLTCDQPEEAGARFVLLIDTELLRVIQDASVLDPLFLSPYHCTPKTHPAIYPEAYELLMQIIDDYFRNDIMWEMSIYGHLLKLYCLIGKEHFSRLQKDDMNETSRSRENYEKFACLLNYIEAHYAEHITLDDAADFMGFSKFHFSRIFQRQIGTTFHDYLLRTRIRVAQKLLTDDISITDLSYRTGFNNITSFYRCFHKYTGCSPTEYRIRLSSGTELLDEH
ncbi:helix-turn-helix domain-containing protein [Lachnoclostridium sp. Marseille-P6806]|uniref:helix-turn-helix domain-containing protein n=1 Tax=Lachnoclostridium sp. Marseille-P6806 TaxID=2364793 RepID=UPI0010322E01|nr:AraC family transcriptional regulator [Lachnoclostridium sp. Marseille-P6806]